MDRSPSNVLLILTDQHSFRYVGSRDADRGGESVETPALDRLANSSIGFETAYCPVPLCTPSRYAMLTGREAMRAGAWSNASVLDPDVTSLPKTLSNSGYKTYLEGKMHFGGTVQFGGFDQRTYGDLTGQSAHQAEPPTQYSHPPDYRRLLTEVGTTSIPESLLQETRTVEESIAALREHRHGDPDRPWFLCASFSRPHWPRTAPSRFVDKYWPDDAPEPRVNGGETDDHPLVRACAERTTSDELSHGELMRARAGYFAAVEYIDEIVGDFLLRLDNAGFLDDTIIVYASDHGELAGEHGLWEKRTWHEAATRVPLFVQLPSHRNGDATPATLRTPVSLLDLYPTLCHLVDVAPPDDLDGRDRSGAVKTGTEPDSHPVIVDCFGMFGNDHLHYRMVRDGRYKYVQFRDAPELLFDLETDPLETTNRAADPDADASAALQRLRGVVDESLDFAEVDRRRKRDAERAREYRLATPKGGPNQYHMPDGRVIDGDTLLYHPHVITDDPTAAYDDYPNE
jgi:choline-sulfatase